jgi:hypothetical protein
MDININKKQFLAYRKVHFRMLSLVLVIGAVATVTLTQSIQNRLFWTVIDTGTMLDLLVTHTIAEFAQDGGPVLQVRDPQLVKTNVNTTREIINLFVEKKGYSAKKFDLSRHDLFGVKLVKEFEQLLEKGESFTIYAFDKDSLALVVQRTVPAGYPGKGVSTKIEPCTEALTCKVYGAISYGAIDLGEVFLLQFDRQVANEQGGLGFLASAADRLETLMERLDSDVLIEPADVRAYIEAETKVYRQRLWYGTLIWWFGILLSVPWIPYLRVYSRFNQAICAESVKWQIDVYLTLPYFWQFMITYRLDLLAVSAIEAAVRQRIEAEDQQKIQDAELRRRREQELGQPRPPRPAQPAKVISPPIADEHQLSIERFEATFRELTTGVRISREALSYKAQAKSSQGFRKQRQNWAKAIQAQKDFLKRPLLEQEKEGLNE